VIVKTINKLKSKENRIMLYKDMALMMALFFNPFGFDAVQYSLILLTGSLWKANFVLYCIAGLFFGVYIYFTKLLSRGNSYFVRKSSENNNISMFDFEGGPCLNVGGKIKFEKLEWQIHQIKEEDTSFPNFASVQLIVSPIY